MDDIEIIRAVRRLCIQHQFSEATALAHQVKDSSSRETLSLICNSFQRGQIQRGKVAA